MVFCAQSEARAACACDAVNDPAALVALPAAAVAELAAEVALAVASPALVVAVVADPAADVAEVAALVALVLALLAEVAAAVALLAASVALPLAVVAEPAAAVAELAAFVADDAAVAARVQDLPAGEGGGGDRGPGRPSGPRQDRGDGGGLNQTLSRLRERCRGVRVADQRRRGEFRQKEDFPHRQACRCAPRPDTSPASGGRSYFSAAIQASIRWSSRASGSGPSVSRASWKVRTLNFGPSSRSARARISRRRISPIL